MQLKEMTVFEVVKRGIKKMIMETTSVKFWGAVFVGYLNYRIVIEKNSFDIFGMFSFLALLGIREAADYLGKKTL
jgi:hypothetical protein